MSKNFDSYNRKTRSLKKCKIEVINQRTVFSGKKHEDAPSYISLMINKLHACVLNKANSYFVETRIYTSTNCFVFYGFGVIHYGRFFSYIFAKMYNSKNK